MLNLEKYTLILKDSKVWFTFLLILVSSYIVYVNAWVTEDAYITFRYVDNFISGHGPVFNIGERVQGFTHPLWFILLSLLRYFGFNIAYASIFLGFLFNILTVLFFARFIHHSNNFYFSILLFVTILYSCSSFVDFQTSGLEGSLNNFLVLLCFIFAFSNKTSIFKMSIATSLLLVNRLDNIFIISPLLFYVFFKNYKFLKGKITSIFACFSPIIIWEIFSLVYYGFIFPNSKYAKVVASPLLAKISSGLVLFWDFFFWEPFPAIMSVIALIIIGLLFFKKKINEKYLYILLCCVFNIIYLLFIGGDYMRGRFLMPLFFIITLAFVNLFSDHIKIKGKYVIIIILVIIGLVSKNRADYAPEDDVTFITNARIGDYNNGRLFTLLQNKGIPTHFWAYQGLNLANLSKNNKITLVIPNVGMEAYFAGNNVTVIDTFGLTDAFVARTPVEDALRPGHITHLIPLEYILTRANNSIIVNSSYQFSYSSPPPEHWNNTELEALWKDMHIITSGKIFSIERINAIIRVWTEYGI